MEKASCLDCDTRALFVDGDGRETSAFSAKERPFLVSVNIAIERSPLRSDTSTHLPAIENFVFWNQYSM